MKTRNLVLCGLIALWTSMCCASCRTADDADGWDDSSSEPPSSDSNDGNGAGISKDHFAPFNCQSGDAASCDVIACSFGGTLESVKANCLEHGQIYCAAVDSCLTTFTACLSNLCPPGVQAADDVFADTCATAFSVCLADAAERFEIPASPNRKSNIMPCSDDYICNNTDGFSGVWYTFSDSDDDGLGDSEFIGDEPYCDGDKVCVTGVASRVQNGADGVYWGAGFGGNLCSDYAIMDCGGENNLGQQFLGVEFNIDGYWGAELRVLFHELGSDESAYVVVPPGATHVIALVDQADVWYKPGNPIDTNNIDAIQFHVATNPETATPFEFCITHLSALLKTSY